MYEWIAALTKNERVLSTIAGVAARLPDWFLALICKSIAMLLYGLSGTGLRQRILSNMERLLPHYDARSLKRERFRYYENMVFAVYEILLGSYLLPARAERRFAAEGEEHLKEALKLGKGAIVYTPHVGNFFYYYWYLSRRYHCTTIATASSEELRPLYLRMHAIGCDGFDYDTTPPLELLRKLRKHLQSNGVIFILGDFYRPTFPRSRFFGKPTRTPDGAALLSIDMQAPVVPFCGWRERGFLHRIRFEEPMHLSEAYNKAERSEATVLLNQYMERVITERPAQWFYWFNADERWEKEHTIERTEQSASSKEAEECNQTQTA
ncbi:lysophospholipid acyltransferase family protein [Paenibacillus sp. YYML68]|uniref:lysophospholipid acyltransferase family protein n=1 Tax=Paenibacillus sp. YYML68 TaxID=2909250 RepID=UPI0024917BE9|nr:lipid A biosynthesis acyltransferase [Paenibacillus sp. YYML68]